jgi:two-component system sensor histidine kinase BaeS
VAATWLERGIAEIEEAALRMEQLIDELVDLAQLQTGSRLRLHCRPTDLVHLATVVTGAVQARNAGRCVQLELAQPSVIGSWDARRLRRVLENLLSNALKYSPPDRAILLYIGAHPLSDGDWAVLALHDCGRGIPTTDLPYIFEPFWRGSNVGEVAGSGLGLAGVKWIVKAHGGCIAVQSREGEGTTVIVRLPCQLEEPWDPCRKGWNPEGASAPESQSVA